MFSHGSALSAATVHEHGSLLLRLAGELDVATALTLRTVVADLVQPELRDVTVDLNSVTFVDVAGVRTLLEAQRAATAAGATFRLSGVNGSTRRIIQLTDHPVLADAIEDPPTGRTA